MSTIKFISKIGHNYANNYELLISLLQRNFPQENGIRRQLHLLLINISRKFSKFFWSTTKRALYKKQPFLVSDDELWLIKNLLYQEGLREEDYIETIQLLKSQLKHLQNKANDAQQQFGFGKAFTNAGLSYIMENLIIAGPVENLIYLLRNESMLININWPSDRVIATLCVIAIERLQITAHLMHERTNFLPPPCVAIFVVGEAVENLVGQKLQKLVDHYTKADPNAQQSIALLQLSKIDREEILRLSNIANTTARQFIVLVRARTVESHYDRGAAPVGYKPSAVDEESQIQLLSTPPPTPSAAAATIAAAGTSHDSNVEFVDFLPWTHCHVCNIILIGYECLLESKLRTYGPGFIKYCKDKNVALAVGGSLSSENNNNNCSLQVIGVAYPKEDDDPSKTKQQQDSERKEQFKKMRLKFDIRGLYYEILNNQNISLSAEAEAVEFVEHYAIKCKNGTRKCQLMEEFLRIKSGQPHMKTIVYFNNTDSYNEMHAHLDVRINPANDARPLFWLKEFADPSNLSTMKRFNDEAYSVLLLKTQSEIELCSFTHCNVGLVIMVDCAKKVKTYWKQIAKSISTMHLKVLTLLEPENVKTLENCCGASTIFVEQVQNCFDF